MEPTRRSILASILSVPPALMMGAGRAGAQTPLPLPPTPSCGDEPALTAAQTAGPFYTPNAPLKRDLGADVSGGRPITLAGFVVDRNCKPLPGALVEVWHADEKGAYDNAGFRLRGHQIADEAGRWGFTTIVTSHYSFRTAHYHFRVQVPRGRTLVTQLYFPDDPHNKADRLFDRRLVMRMSGDASHRLGRFDFVM